MFDPSAVLHEQKIAVGPVTCIAGYHRADVKNIRAVAKVKDLSVRTMTVCILLSRGTLIHDVRATGAGSCRWRRRRRDLGVPTTLRLLAGIGGFWRIIAAAIRHGRARSGTARPRDDAERGP